MGQMFVPTGKHPIISPSLFLETSLEGKYLCCLSDRDVFIIRSYLWPYVEWPTRFARTSDGKRWEVASNDEFQSFLEYCQELDQKITGGDFMTCLEQGLTDIANALRYMADRQCCPDSNVTVNGGVVGTYTDGDGITRPIYGSQPPYINDGVTPPPGFDTYEDYLLNKCQVANLVFDGWMLTLRGLSGLTIINATVLAALIGLTLASAILFPPAAIPVMIAALITLGAELGLLGSLATQLESQRADIICDLYNSNTIESMVAVLSDAIDVAIAALELAGPIGLAVQTVALLLVNSDTLSQLLSGIAGASYPDVDCSGCVENCYTWTFDDTLEDWSTAPSFRDVTQDSEDGGSMKLDGYGGGGTNYSIAVISGADFASAFGLTTGDFNIGQIAGTIQFKTINPDHGTDFIFRIWSTVTNHDVNLSGSFPSGTTGDISVGASAEELDRIEILAGNSSVSGEAFVVFVDQIDLCIEAA